MAAIILPNKHYTQPQGRLDINWAHPSTDALALCVADDAYDLVSRRNLFAVGTPNPFNVTPEGRALHFSGSHSLGIESTPFMLKRDVGLSVLSFHRRTSTDQNQQLIRPPNGQPDFLLRTNDSNNDRFYMRLGGSFVIAGAASAPIGQFNIQHGNWDKKNVSLYRNGRLIAEESTTTGFGGVEPTHYYIGGRDDTNERFSGDIVLTVVWVRGLVGAEIQNLATNPWQLFRADPVRIYSLPPVITIPTLSNPGVIDITTTSARPQVTLTF